MPNNQYREAKAPEKRAYKKLHHIEIEPVKGENGGHMVTHHFQNDGMSYREPERHMFDKDGYGASGEHVFEHLSKHMKVPLPDPKTGERSEKEEHEGPRSQMESASEPIESDVNA
jgi:hypothetical protein